MTLVRRAAAGARWALHLELRLYGGLLRAIRRRPAVPSGATPHPYSSPVVVLLWAITAVSAVELVALHLLIPWEAVRLAADVLGIWGVVWCLGLTCCHAVYPHLTDDREVVVRAATRTVLVLPRDTVSAVGVRERSRSGSRSVQADPAGSEEAGTGAYGVLHVQVGNRTNVDLTLREPVEVVVRGVPVLVGEVRLFVDDPRAFAAAVRIADAPRRAAGPTRP